MGYKRVARIDQTNPPGSGGLSHAIAVDELDLHGMKVVQARRRIGSFLRAAARTHPGAVVRIITGRGRHSPGAPALGPALEEELSRLTALVAEFRPAPDGGSYLIRLR